MDMCGTHVGKWVTVRYHRSLGDWHIGLFWNGSPCYHHRHTQARHGSGMEHTPSWRGDQWRPGMQPHQHPDCLQTILQTCPVRRSSAITPMGPLPCLALLIAFIHLQWPQAKETFCLGLPTPPVLPNPTLQEPALPDPMLQDPELWVQAKRILCPSLPRPQDHAHGCEPGKTCLVPFPAPITRVTGEPEGPRVPKTEEPDLWGKEIQLRMETIKADPTSGLRSPRQLEH